MIRLLLLSSAVLAAGILAGFAFCLFSPPALSSWLADLFPFRKWHEVVERLLGTIRAYRHSPGALAGALGMSFAANLVFVGVTALAILVVHPASLAPKVILIIPTGLIANSLPITPGGLGVGETAFNALFKLVGLQGGAEALLCWRIWSLAVSLLGLPLYLRGFSGKVHAAHPELPAQSMESSAGR